MKKLRMLMAAALTLAGAGTIVAQPPTPPPSGLYPSTPAPGAYPPTAMPGWSAPAPGVEPAAGAPAVAIGDNASSTVPKMWFTLGMGVSWVTPTPNPSPLLTTSDVSDA